MILPPATREPAGFPGFPRSVILRGKIKLFLVKLICALVPSKKWRGAIRGYFMWFRYRGINFGCPRLPVKKRSRPINLAFGFDGGFVRQTGVALASLLSNSKDRCSYNIYCVVDDSVTPDQRAALAGLVKTQDQDSALTFLEANRDFDRAWCGHFSVGVYYRLMLPVLLPEMDEIIYADGDVIFVRDLLELADLDLGENLIAGVIEAPGDYINSGFLVLNLARLRQEKTYEIWREEARREQYFFADQDVINVTCRGRILYLPIKFNFCYRSSNLFRCKKDLIPPSDFHDLKYDTVMIHYTANPKPWRNKLCHLAGLWWEYAKLTPFYESLLAELQGKAD